MRKYLIPLLKKVYVYQKHKENGKTTQTVEIIYKFIGAIDIPNFDDLDEVV